MASSYRGLVIESIACLDTFYSLGGPAAAASLQLWRRRTCLSGLAAQVLEKQFGYALGDSPTQLVATAPKAVGMKDAFAAWDLFSFQPHAAFARGPPAYDVGDDAKALAAGQDRGVGGGEVPQEGRAHLGRRARVPIVRLFGAADDGAAVKVARHGEGPGPVGVLARHRRRAGVRHKAGLACALPPTPRQYPAPTGEEG